MTIKSKLAWIDISVPLRNGMVHWPGDPPFQISRIKDLTRGDTVNLSNVNMGAHSGTHVDAPRHMVKGGKSLDQISIENFVGRGVLIDARKGFSLGKVKKSDIHKGDIVLFYTGMSHHYNESKYYDSYPAITEEIANYLVSKKIKMVGVDACSVDHEQFPVHRILLREEILIIENLTNLQSLAGKEFKIYAFPIKLQIDGAPARVIAETLK